MRRSILLSTFTRKERHAVTSDLNRAIQNLGGWVDTHVAYGNAALSIRFFLPAEALSELSEALSGVGLTLETPVPDRPNSPDDTELPVSLSVTFIHDEPDLRQTIPSVPG